MAQQPTINDITAVNAPKVNLHASLDIDEREGIYCSTCNNIFYINKPYSKIFRINPCPICNGQLLWITTNDQPLQE